jgi:heme exporter protein B
LSVIATILDLALKDLKTEFRKPQELSSALMFTFASVFIFGLALSGTSSTIREIYAAMIWVILYFAATFIFASSFHNETDQGTIGGLRTLPIPMNLVLYGKTLYCLVLLTLIMGTLIGSATVFLNAGLRISMVLTVLLIFILAAVGLSLLGCLISALLIFSEGKRLLIVFLLFPISLPILVPCISSTLKIAEGLSLLDILPEMQLIVGFTILVFIASHLSFEGIISE